MNKGEHEKLDKLRYKLNEIARTIATEPATPKTHWLMTELGEAHGICAGMLAKYLKNKEISRKCALGVSLEKNNDLPKTAPNRYK